jgi:hypothetical protein
MKRRAGSLGSIASDSQLDGLDPDDYSPGDQLRLAIAAMWRPSTTPSKRRTCNVTRPSRLSLPTRASKAQLATLAETLKAVREAAQAARPDD